MYGGSTPNRQVQSDNAHLPRMNRCKGWMSCSSYKQGPKGNCSGKTAGTQEGVPSRFTSCEPVFVGPGPTHNCLDPLQAA